MQLELWTEMETEMEMEMVMEVEIDMGIEAEIETEMETQVESKMNMEMAICLLMGGCQPTVNHHGGMMLENLLLIFKSVTVLRHYGKTGHSVHFKVTIQVSLSVLINSIGHSQCFMMTDTWTVM